MASLLNYNFTNDPVNIIWFRRDLRLDDNTALDKALSSGLPVLPLFIFDTNITGELPADDPRITFIYDSLFTINKRLSEYGSSLVVLRGDPESLWEMLALSCRINTVYVNRDYEPYSVQRDHSVASLLDKHGIQFISFKDQVIFEGKEIVKSDGRPYTVFTPYSKRWLNDLMSQPQSKSSAPPSLNAFLKTAGSFPEPGQLGIKLNRRVRHYDLSMIGNYNLYRDFPALDCTTYLGPHLRFGTVSIREIVRLALSLNRVFLGELIWREFFMQILFNYPRVVMENFKTRYDNIRWRNDPREFDRWCSGQTGYPIVDAGMRQLNETGYMHNRVRMITAAFLCKHLLIDWRLGEAFFAMKLLDYELSSNNGNWQWAAGTGSDAVPYFRIFNPILQAAKYDKEGVYVNKWVPEKESSSYPMPVVDHDLARKRAFAVYREGIV